MRCLLSTMLLLLLWSVIFKIKSNSNEYDDEDVVAEPVTEKLKERKLKEKNPMRKSREGLNIPVERIWEYKVEIMCLAVIGLVLAVYAVGKARNHLLIVKWLRKYLTVLSPAFTYIGDLDMKDSGKGQLTYIGRFKHALWCTGSVTCKGMLLEFELFPRQSLLDTFLHMAFFNSPITDKLTITVYLEDNVDVCVVLMGNRKLISMNKSLIKQNEVCKDRKPNIIIGETPKDERQDFFLSSELNEFFEVYGKDSSLGKLVHDVQPHIRHILLTDLEIYWNLEKSSMMLGKEGPTGLGPKTLTIELSATVGKVLSSWVDLTEFFHHLAQFLEQLSMKPRFFSNEGKSKLEKTRSMFAAKKQKEQHKLRVEKAMERKDKRVKEENERILATTDPDLQLKLQAKKEKREQREATRKQKKSQLSKVIM